MSKLLVEVSFRVYDPGNSNKDLRLAQVRSLFQLKHLPPDTLAKESTLLAERFWESIVLLGLLE